MKPAQGSIKVKFLSVYRMELGVHTIEHPVCQADLTVKELIQQIDRSMEGKVGQVLGLDFDSIPEEMLILLNGKSIFHIHGFDTRITDNDELAIMPMVFGG